MDKESGSGADCERQKKEPEEDFLPAGGGCGYANGRKELVTVLAHCGHSFALCEELDRGL